MSFTTVQFLFENILTWRQVQVLKRPALPKTLTNVIDNETFKKSQAYSRAKANFSIVSSIYHFVQNIAFIKFDILPKFWAIGGSIMSYLPFSGVIVQSLCFLFVFQVYSTIMSLPTSYYSHFVLEEKFGFNKLTTKLWITDLIKSFVLGLVFGLPILAGFLKIFDYFGDNFILWVCGFIFVVQVVGIVIYPTLIQPFFNTLTPLGEGELKTSIEDLAKKNNFPCAKIMVIDGSKRSSHSNAYFYGFPFAAKNIVLFDTLIETSTVEETTAVLAHEIGHWALNHIPRIFVVQQIQLLLTFTLFVGFIKNGSLYSQFGFTTQQPVLIGFLLFNDVLQPLDMVLKYLTNLAIRHHEYEADGYAKDQGYVQQLGSSLINLQVKNLSAMDADWLYSAYHYSHPILSERLEALGYVSEKKSE